MKIKGEEYVRLHRILTNISTTSIWDVLRSGGDFSELLDKVPDEFDGWVRETVKELNEDFSRIKEDYLKIFGRLVNKLDLNMVKENKAKGWTVIAWVHSFMGLKRMVPFPCLK
ncbi:MAG: hypothetical protein EB120_13080 [Proteobacteria bacterium]|nr:hypothetical protein [Pseudomonadota bacterium]